MSTHPRSKRRTTIPVAVAVITTGIAGSTVSPVQPPTASAQITATQTPSESPAEIPTVLHYEEVTALRGQSVHVPSPLEAAGLDASGYGFHGSPAGVSDWITIHEDGSLTVSPPLDAYIQDRSYTIYADAKFTNERITLHLTVPVRHENWFGEATENDPAWHFVYAPRGIASRFSPVVNEDGSLLPEGTTFSFEDDVPEWFEVDPKTGHLSAVPPVDEYSPTGSYGIYSLIITYPDGSQDRSTVDLYVTRQNESVGVSYGEDSNLYNHLVWDTGLEVAWNESVVVPAPTAFNFRGDNAEPLAQSPDIQFKPAGPSSGPSHTPDWVTVHEDGSLRVSPPEWVEPGMRYIPILAEFADGTSSVPVVGVRVLPAASDSDDSNDVNSPGNPSDGQNGSQSSSSGYGLLAVISGLIAALGLATAGWFLAGTPPIPFL